MLMRSQKLRVYAVAEQHMDANDDPASSLWFVVLGQMLVICGGDLPKLLS